MPMTADRSDAQLSFQRGFDSVRRTAASAMNEIENLCAAYEKDNVSGVRNSIEC